MADASAVDAVWNQVAAHFRSYPYDHLSYALHDGPGDLSRCHTQPLDCHNHEGLRIAIQDHANWSATGGEVTVHSFGQIVHGLLDVL